MGNLEDETGETVGGDDDPFHFGQLRTNTDLVLAAKNIAVNSDTTAQLLALVPNFLLIDAPGNVPGLKKAQKVRTTKRKNALSLLEVWWQ